MLSARFGALVNIEKVAFGRQEINIEKFVLHNPPDFSTPHALDIDVIDIDAPYINYIKKEIKIKEIEVHTAELNIVFKTKKGLDSNWSSLLGTLSTDKYSKKKREQEEKSGQYAVIEVLKINKLTVHIITPGLKTETKVFNDMVFYNVVTTRGDITRHITQVVVYYMISQFANILNIPTGGFFSIFSGLSKPS